MTPRILLLGNKGQLGWELERVLLPLGDMTAMDYPQINLADPENIRRVVQSSKPNIILNATAYTNVDKVEEEPDLAMAVNAIGPGILAEEAEKLNAGLVHYSTDYVFDGKSDRPYTEDDVPNPINVYGKTKRAGEEEVSRAVEAYFVFRTSWVYSLRRLNFVTNVLKWARQKESLKIVDDQTGTPTWARVLAETTGLILAAGKDHLTEFMKENHGIYHLVCEGSCNRFEWAKAILALDPDRSEQKVKEILPAKSAEFPTAAERPCYSALSTKKIQDVFHINTVPWEQALALMFES